MKTVILNIVILMTFVSLVYGEIVIKHEDAKQMVINGDGESSVHRADAAGSYSYVVSGRDTGNSTIRALIMRICREEDMDHRLIEAVVQIESQFQPYAVSRVGAMGLMQLMPDTADCLGVKNPFDIQENISAGVKYLKYLHNRFSGNIELALAAYNAGPAAVEMYNGIPPYPETIRYVEKIMTLFREAGGVSPFGGKMKVMNDDEGLTITNTIYQKRSMR